MADSKRSPPLEGIDLETWIAVATILEWLPPALDASLHDIGLTHFEYGILYALADAPDHTLRMSVLAGYANSSLSRLSRAASRLEAKSLVRRTPDPADGRSTLAILTDQGRHAYEAATPVHEENVRRLLLSALTETQKKQLREIARRVMEAIQDGGAKSTP